MSSRTTLSHAAPAWPGGCVCHPLSCSARMQKWLYPSDTTPTSSTSKPTRLPTTSSVNKGIFHRHLWLLHDGARNLINFQGCSFNHGKEPSMPPAHARESAQLWLIIYLSVFPIAKHVNYIKNILQIGKPPLIWSFNLVFRVCRVCYAPENRFVVVRRVCCIFATDDAPNLNEQKRKSSG